MNPEAIEAAKAAVSKEMRLRTYDRHAHNADVFEEGVTDVATAALEAAAPYLKDNYVPGQKTLELAAAMLDQNAIREARAAELEAAAEWLAIPSQDGGGFAATWLRTRATTIRAGGF